MDLKRVIVVTLLMLVFSRESQGARRIDAKTRAMETVKKRSVQQKKRAVEEDMSVNELLDLSDDETMTVTRSAKTSQGLRVERLQEKYKGIDVFDSSVVVEINKDRKLTGDASGTLIQGIEEDLESVTVNISYEHALQLSVEAEGDQDVKNNIFDPTSSLQIYLDANDRARLVYFLQYMVIKNGIPKRPAFFVDAITGEILLHWNNLESNQCENGITAVGGNEQIGKTQYGESPFCLDMMTDGEICYLENKYVRVIDMMNTYDESINKTISFNCNEGYNDSVNGGYSPAMDAFFHGTVAGKLFEEWFETTPIPKKMPIRVHFGPNIPTAFWNGKFVAFGDGGSKFYPLVGLDIVCHEIGHGVTQYASGLIMFGQSGGLNEAFSDIVGETCESFLLTNDFFAGKGFMKNKERTYMRSAENPPIDGKSIKHVDDYYPGLNPHHSSGIFNRVFFVILQQKGLNIKQVFNVFYHANLLYWHHLSSFEDAACGVLKSAYDLGQKPTAYIRAFQDVGIARCDLSKHIQSLVNNRTYDDITVSVESEPVFAFETPTTLYGVFIYAESSNGNVGIKYIAGTRNMTEYNFDDDAIPTSISSVEIPNPTNTVIYFILTSPNGRFMDDVSVIAGYRES